MRLPQRRKLRLRRGDRLNAHTSTIRKIILRYADAARSGAGKAMLLVTVVLATLVLVNHDAVRALITGGILYIFLITALAVGRR